MKREMDLIRALLLSLERGEDDVPNEMRERFTQQEIAGHAALIIEAGLAEGMIAKGGFNEVMRADLDRLTWAGHDFLDAAREETLWNKAKEKIMKPGMSYTFEFVKEWLKAEIRARVGHEI